MNLESKPGKYHSTQQVETHNQTESEVDPLRNLIEGNCQDVKDIFGLVDELKEGGYDSRDVLTTAKDIFGKKDFKTIKGRLFQLLTAHTSKRLPPHRNLSIDQKEPRNLRNHRGHVKK